MDLPENIPPSSKNIIDNLMSDALDDSASKDFEFARANLRNLIEKGNMTVDNLVQLAEASQHPGVYSVLAKTIDSIVAANKELLDLQSKIRTIKDVSAKVNGGSSPKTVNQTAIFVGSTSDLQRTLKKTLKGMNFIEKDKEGEEGEE
jgi:hypothetical protein